MLIMMRKKMFAIYKNSFDKSINLNTLDFTEHFTENLTNLQILNLSQNKLRNVSEETFVGLYNLLYLDLSENSLDFSENNDTEIEFPIPKLYKETNMIKRKSSSLPLTVFKDIYRLRSLNLKSNEIHFLFPEIFENFTQLKEIDLSENRIRSWDIPIFNKSDQLQIVLLRNNDIQYLSDAMITDFSKPNLTVDLRDNILNCSCSLMAFDNELNDTHFLQKDSYQCKNGTEYVSVNDYLQEVYEYNLCSEVEPYLDPSKKMLIIGVMSGVIIILIFLSIVYYRNRW
ncbi:Leucine-rich repeat transmembrane neuronal protein 2 [Armadillidium nasatum]|uniref:Leucine-rich repeat transmembrane neuronal protein 2 n=1 Tax=Armadillidium nasatum TaxID=96803 RepID=A0A5N5SGQ6_9CRUS|nr:Leucine-rich repeat transmembrane neuronal protein 2 [Armadillidium nasatum]